MDDAQNLDGFDAHGAQVEYEPLDEAHDEHMDFEGNSAAPADPARWEGSTRLPPCEFSAFQQRFGRDPTPSEAELDEKDWDDIAPDDDGEAEAEATATETTADKQAAAAANTAGVRKKAAAAAKGPFSLDGTPEDAIQMMSAETARARADKAADEEAMSLRVLQDLQGQMDLGIRVNPALARMYGVGGTPGGAPADAAARQMHGDAELENGTAAQQQAADEAAASAVGVDEQRRAAANSEIDMTASDPNKKVCPCPPPTPHSPSNAFEGVRRVEVLGLNTVEASVIM